MNIRATHATRPLARHMVIRTYLMAFLMALLTIILTGCQTSTVYTSDWHNPKVDCGEFSLEIAQPLPWQITGPSNWVIIGSSSAAGAGATPGYSWADLLTVYAIEKGAQVLNIAKGGATTYQALGSHCQVASSRFQPDPAHNIDQAVALRANLVIISFPSNDQAMNYSTAESVSNLMNIRWQLAQQNIPTVILSSQPRNMDANRQQKLIEFNQQLRPLLGPCFVDVHDLLLGPSGALDPRYDFDGVHLNNMGHEVVFQALKARLDSEECVQFLP